MLQAIHDRGPPPGQVISRAQTGPDRKTMVSTENPTRLSVLLHADVAGSTGPVRMDESLVWA